MNKNTRLRFNQAPTRSSSASPTLCISETHAKRLPIKKALTDQVTAIMSELVQPASAAVLLAL